MEQTTQSSKLRALLDNATGQPEHVVAVNLDVRGFSSFCERNDSTNVVVFIREVCKRLLDRYFRQAPFFKMTGDGLLIVIPCAGEPGKVVTSTLDACLKAHEAFPSLCAGEAMINFRVPDKIGIGLSRGAVSRIVANGETLDYSGRVLNLASRLMNLARPSGIVFDAHYATGLLSPSDLEPTFSRAKVWLWGLAESEPIEVYYSAALGTRIPAMYRRRLDVRKWASERSSSKRFERFESMEKSGLRYVYSLDQQPRDPDEIIVTVQYPSDLVSKLGGTAFQLPRNFFDYRFEGGESKVAINTSLLVDELRQQGFVSNHECKFVFRYPR